MTGRVLRALMSAVVAVGVVPATGAAAQKPQRELNTLQDLAAALRACWVPPPLAQSRPAMQITVRFGFKRSGELLGDPRITFQSAPASDEERLAYRVAVAETMRRCNPLPFTEALGNAVAGRPFTMRFIDNRKLKRAERV